MLYMFQSTMQHFDPNDIDNFSSNSTTPTILGAGEGSEITYTNNGNSMTFDMPYQGSLKKSLIPCSNDKCRNWIS